MSTDTPTMLSPRGTSVCRGCGAKDLVSVLDLGNQPLANELLTAPTQVSDLFPLHLRMCGECGLGQVGEYAAPERIFSDDYPYLSSASSSWVAHARGFAETMTKTLGLGGDDLVVEIASNDGYLLGEFLALGVGVLGVEPAGNVAAIAVTRGVRTVESFFDADLARKLARDHRTPSLIVANNVMAHVPDLHGFLEGLSALCGPESVIAVENPSMATLLIEAQFDTIYHEHFSYLSAHAVAAAAANHDLTLTRVDRLPTHGGSNRYWLRRSGANPEPSVADALAAEDADGLLDPERWATFAATSLAATEGLRHWLLDRRAEGRKVAAYGAAAKGNTFLNAVGEASRSIAVVVDASPEKQGRFLPGSAVPIRAPAALADTSADDVLILPWNLAAEIVPLVRELLPSAATWTALPRMTRLR